MLDRSGAPRYPALAIAIHWFAAVCVFGLIPLGIVMARLDFGPTQERLFFIHASVGLLVFLLTVVRLALRAAGRMPPPAAVLTGFERIASRMAHFSLYLLLILTPVVGWFGVNAYGDDVSFFGLFDLPAVVAKDEELSDQIFAMHLACGILIALLVVFHITGAVVHRIRRDGVNERMWPGR